MQKWVRYVDIIILFTALIILIIDYGIKQDILRATREFYVGREQTEGHKGRTDSDSDISSSVLPAISDDSESVEDGVILESIAALDQEGIEENVVLPQSAKRYRRSPNQAIPGSSQPVGS